MNWSPGSKVQGSANRGEAGRLRPWQGLLLLGALAVVWGSVERHHLGNVDPLHFDEWTNIGEARDLIWYGSLRFPPGNTGFPVLDNDVANRKLEFGFPVLLGELAAIGNLDLVSHYHHLAGLTAVFGGAALFVFVRSVSGSFFAGLFAVLFLGTARSNNQFLGVNYFLPLTLCLPFIFLLLTGLNEAQGKENRDRLAWLSLSLACLLVIATMHPPSLMAGLLLSGLLLALAPESWKDWRPLAAGAGVFLAVCVVFFAARWEESLWTTAESFSHLLILPGRWHLKGFTSLPLTYFASWPLLVLAFVGLVGAFFRTRQRFLAVWFALILLSDISFRETRTSFLIPYQRMWHFWQFAAASLAGIGLAMALGWLSERLRWVPPTLRPATLGTLALAAVAMVFALPNSDERLQAYDRTTFPIPAEGRRVLEWIGDRYAPPSTVLSEPKLAPFVKPISGLDASDAALAAIMEGRPLSLATHWASLSGGKAEREDLPDLVVWPRGRGEFASQAYRLVHGRGALSVYEKLRREEPAGNGPQRSGRRGSAG